MATKPILFSTPMVQAIMSGRKTQTRRIIKPKYCNTNIELRTDKYGKSLVEIQNDVPLPVKNDDGTTTYRVRAYSTVIPKINLGDILWVRETFQDSQCFDYNMTGFQYKADKAANIHAKEYNIRWKPSIFMPKDACRLFLKVTNVRAERLQDITADDAKSEGIEFSSLRTFPDYRNYLAKDKDPHHAKFNLLNPIESFKTLWKSINGVDQWDTNPWVWVYDFEQVDRPKDF